LIPFADLGNPFIGWLCNLLNQLQDTWIFLVENGLGNQFRLKQLTQQKMNAKKKRQINI
jgi:hypothetical protein